MITFFEWPAGNHRVFEEQEFDSCIQKSFDGFSRRVDNGLAFDVEAGVQDHLAASGFSNGLQKRVELSVVESRDGLNAGGPIHVRDGRQSSAMLGSDIHGRDHVRKFSAVRDVEPFIDFSQGDRGRERTEGFAHFDHRVDAIAHFGMARVGQDAAMPQGARAEFHAAAIPADHATIRDQPRGVRAGVGKVCEVVNLDAIVKFSERLFNLRERVGRPVKGNGNARVVNTAVLGGAKSG